MKTSTERMIARVDGAIGWMVFNNPARRNAISVDMWEAVPEILDAYARNDAVRVVVIAGAGGKAFMSGADISEFAEKRSRKDDVDAYNARVERASRAILDFAKPTIAMIQGYCVGGGVSIALCCDMRMAADNARFIVPAAKLSLGYTFMGVKRLVDVVGPAFAKEIFFTSRQFNATEAYEMGLVNRVRPAAELEAYVTECAAMIAENAPLTIASVKLSVREYLKGTGAADLAACDAAVAACFSSQDYIEGRTAFMEKRKPVFHGR